MRGKKRTSQCSLKFLPEKGRSLHRPFLFSAGCTSFASALALAPLAGQRMYDTCANGKTVAERRWQLKEAKHGKGLFFSSVSQHSSNCLPAVLPARPLLGPCRLDRGLCPLPLPSCPAFKLRWTAHLNHAGRRSTALPA